MRIPKVPFGVELCVLLFVALVLWVVGTWVIDIVKRALTPYNIEE